MQAFFDFVFHTLTNPDRLIEFLSTVVTGWWGYALFCGIIFSETGLLMGFFLPGDSLLFTIGVVAGAGELNIVAIIAAFVFNVINPPAQSTPIATDEPPYETPR